MLRGEPQKNRTKADKNKHTDYGTCLGLARTIYIYIYIYIYGVYKVLLAGKSLNIRKIKGVYIRFWPTLDMFYAAVTQHGALRRGAALVCCMH